MLISPAIFRDYHVVELIKQEINFTVMQLCANSRKKLVVYKKERTTSGECSLFTAFPPIQPGTFQTSTTFSHSEQQNS